MKIIDSTLLNTVSEQAKTNVRLRMNYNFHKQMDEPVQRLLNALEPNTYLPPHRHLQAQKSRDIPRTKRECTYIFCLMTKAQLHKSTRLTLLKVFSEWR